MQNDTKQTRQQLIEICKERNVKGYSSKNKNELIKLLSSPTPVVSDMADEKESVNRVETTSRQKGGDTDIVRLNYIGSKYQLLEWLTENIKEKTGWDSLKGKRMGDLFSGTGIVSHHFRNKGAIVLSNDAERYSSIITSAFTTSVYTDTYKTTLHQLQTELNENQHQQTAGYITTHYSPFEDSERQFFTIDNAKRIDYLRKRLEDLKEGWSESEYALFLATLISCADLVSNVPAVYGCYLKTFKSKALKDLILRPIHTIAEESNESHTSCSDVLEDNFLSMREYDAVYLDPPYNERQYSKNYFPLNMIAKTPNELEEEPPLKGKTGIPSNCFISPFCKKGKTVEDAFDKLCKELRTQWIFLSYSSESIVTKEKMLEIMGKYGEVSIVERDYKRFKSFEYNQDISIKEYLFCLKKN